jgi:hypothetical protein
MAVFTARFFPDVFSRKSGTGLYPSFAQDATLIGTPLTEMTIGAGALFIFVQIAVP